MLYRLLGGFGCGAVTTGNRNVTADILVRLEAEVFQSLLYDWKVPGAEAAVLKKAVVQRRSQAATRLRVVALGRPVKCRSTSMRSAALIRDW